MFQDNNGRNFKIIMADVIGYVSMNLSNPARYFNKKKKNWQDINYVVSSIFNR